MGVTIDGAPDAVRPGELQWEMVTGPQGTIATVTRLTTDIPAFTYTSHYSDYLDPPTTQCTGDANEYGASGLWVDHDLPNTDPAVGSANLFEATRTLAYGPPYEAAQFAEELASEVDNPLSVELDAYVPTGVANAGDTQGAVAAVHLTPNPMSRATLAHVTLPEPGRVLVKLFDVSGADVGAGAAGEFAAGSHTLRLDVSRLPSGVYFVRTTWPGGVSEVSRAVVLR